MPQYNDPFGPDYVPPKPYRPSERRPPPPPSDADSDDSSTEDWGTSEQADEEVASAVDPDIHPSGLVPKLQNVVATFNVGCNLDLKDITQKARNAEYNPRRFSAVIMRLREPKTTALIFKSGKTVCTGAKDEKTSKLAARKFARIIQKLGYNEATFKDFKIQNMVATVDVGCLLNLDKASAYLRPGMYDPLLFPGAIYRMPKPKLVFLIFMSGKVVFTGAKDIETIYKAFEKVYPVLMESRKNV